jgi:hypothetical protein
MTARDTILLKNSTRARLCNQIDCIDIVVQLADETLKVAINTALDATPLVKEDNKTNQPKEANIRIWQHATIGISQRHFKQAKFRMLWKSLYLKSCY